MNSFENLVAHREITMDPPAFTYEVEKHYLTITTNEPLLGAIAVTLITRGRNGATFLPPFLEQEAFDDWWAERCDIPMRKYMADRRHDLADVLDTVKLLAHEDAVRHLTTAHNALIRAKAYAKALREPGSSAGITR